jgi:hypothetical protein
MMSSCRIARRRGDHDSVDNIANFDKPIHRQPWMSYNLSKAWIRCHPRGKNECRSVLLPHENMFDAAMLILPRQDQCLAEERVKRIGDRDFLRQDPGTMSPLRIAADSAPLPCTVPS